MSTCRWTGRPRSERSASNRPIAPTVEQPTPILYVCGIGNRGLRRRLAEAIAKPNRPVPARRETPAQPRMTPIFVLLWFGWALKTGHKGGHFALFSGDCRNSQTRWRRGWDSNPRATFAAAGFQDRCLQPLGHPSVLARRSIHNVSGWPYRTESAFFAFTDEPYARKRQARPSPTPSTFKAYSFTGCQATSNCHLERPPRPSKRHNRAGQYPDPKTKTTRVLSRAVSDVAIGQHHLSRCAGPLLTT